MSSRRWALILGVSSGFGAAAAAAYAAAGYDILGVHLDRRNAEARISAQVEALQATGRLVFFFNDNAARADARQRIIETISGHLEAHGGQVSVVLHSLAFGTLLPFVRPPDEPGKSITQRQLEMTLDVMANSLVYWVQELLAAGLLYKTRIFAMTSSGSHLVWPNYGPVSAAKSALESHVRQLTLELAPHGHTINAILAGVTDTPALAKIPGADGLKTRALARNPQDRLTRPEDVAACLVELSRPGTYWMTGNIIRVDGGEDVCA